MSKTNIGLVNYVKEQLGKPYWYGCFGQTATKTLYEYKQTQYPTYYTAKDFEYQIGNRVHDCIGLIKGYLWSDNFTSVPKYNASQDVNVNGMFSICKERGKISTIPEIVGLLVFMDQHVGVYIGHGYVVEARGHKYGVVKTKLSARPWTHWGKCPWINYEQVDENLILSFQKAATADGFSFPKYGCDGVYGNETKSAMSKCVIKKRIFHKYYNSTRLVQRLLHVEQDGKCGPITDKAIRNYQQKEGLLVDGCCGLKTWEKLLGVN